jgi:CSLREA domain-containing protein
VNPGSSVSWQIVFANAVSSVSTSNFQLINAGVGGNPALESVAAQGGISPNTTWNISVSSGSGSGTLRLDLVNDDGLSHDVTTTLPFVGQNIVIDRELPRVVSAAPTQGATAVDITSNITINFSEPVSFQSPAFTINCGGPIAFTSTPGIPAGSQTSIILDPISALPEGTLCSVNGLAANIFDQAQNQLDGNDDGTAGDDFVLTFTTATIVGAVIVVDSLADDATAGNGNCTLREAMNNANTNSDATAGDCAAGTSDDTITFDSGLFVFGDRRIEGTTSTIVLGGNELSISQDLTIDGPGADKLTVHGNNVSRVISIGSGVDASISGLTFAGGNAAGPGGGISNAGSLVLNKVAVHGNTATTGAGIMHSGDELIINGSTISGNNAIGTGSGGGIHTTGNLLTMTNSTVSGNSSGGPELGFNAGGIFVNGGQVAVTSCTITNNSAGPGGGAGGIDVALSATATIRNSIVAANADNHNVPDVRGTISSGGYNLIGNPAAAGPFAEAGDQVGNQSTPLNPKLGPLANNAGTTLTHKPDRDFPGHDKGCAFGTTTDQRDFARTIDWPTITNGGCTGSEGIAGSATDIGAVELLLATPAPVTISGRAVERNGRGLANVVVDAFDTKGNLVKQTRTNSFGYFTLFDIPSGGDYIVSASTKRYRFEQPSLVIFVNANVDGLVFIGILRTSQ